MLQDNEMVTYDARNQMPYMQVGIKNKLAVAPKKPKEASEKEKAFEVFRVFKKKVSSLRWWDWEKGQVLFLPVLFLYTTHLYNNDILLDDSVN